jgi:hypothetical protein
MPAGHNQLSRRRYLRTLLIQGARSSLQRAKAVSVEKSTPEQIWIRQLACRMPFGKVLVAIANKHARQLWAMLAHDETYDADAWLKHPMVQRARPANMPSRSRRDGMKRFTSVRSGSNGSDPPGENLTNNLDV